MTTAELAAIGTGRRFEIEKALYSSKLHPICRHLIMVIASRINDKNGYILDDHQPTITWLKQATGWARSTLCRRLNDAERAGWLIRKRPSKADAARKHHRTHYTIVIPGEVQPPAAAAGPAEDPAAKLVVELLRERTGKTVTLQHAGLVIGQIMDGRHGRVRNRESYLRKVIRNEANPSKWLPAESCFPPNVKRLRKDGTYEQ
jgi:hypothetical protein